MGKSGGSERTYKLKEDVLYRVVDGEAIVLDVGRGERFSLNRTGTEILKSIDDKMPVESLLRQQAGKYGKKIEAIKEDAYGLIKQLLKQGIIE